MVAALLFTAGLLAAAPDPLTAARQARAWLAAQPPNPQPGLYSGAAGELLFHLEFHRRTGDAAALRDAEKLGRALLAALDTTTDAGLYSGLGGMGFALRELAKSSPDPAWSEGARKAVQRIASLAQPRGAGVEWTEVTDIISGSAGIGLFLLTAQETALAAKAGDRLLELATAAEQGSMWKMNPKFPRIMPNFSHGTAGVAYFLARLYEETKDRKYLTAAESGARHLLAIADQQGESCRIHHHTPGGEDLYYLGWCHGPTGTARLFFQLYKITGGRKWMDAVRRSANALLASGIPEKRTPGFWNNVGQCCGDAGAAEFALSLYRETKERRYLDFAQRLTAHVLESATADGAGLKWVHAENRVSPKDVKAQTGYMQGAAGIGMWLLRLDAVLAGKPSQLRLPDSPWK